MIKDGPYLPPTLSDFEVLAEQAFEEIPGELRNLVQGVAILIEDFPDEEIERDMGLQSPFDLLGLYSGVSLAEKSVHDAPRDIDRVFLYRRPILDFWCETEEDLKGLIRHVLIHEIGHHFGLSDEDMERIEQSAAEAERDGEAGG